MKQFFHMNGRVDLTFFSESFQIPGVSDAEDPFEFPELLSIVTCGSCQLMDSTDLQLSDNQLTFFLEQLQRISNILDSSETFSKQNTTSLYRTKLDFFISLMFRIPDDVFQKDIQSEVLHILNYLSFCFPDFHPRLMKLGAIQFAIECFCEVDQTFESENVQNIFLFFLNTIQDSPNNLQDYFEFEVFSFLKMKLNFLLKVGQVKKNLLQFIFNTGNKYSRIYKLNIQYIKSWLILWNYCSKFVFTQRTNQFPKYIK